MVMFALGQPALASSQLAHHHILSDCVLLDKSCHIRTILGFTNTSATSLSEQFCLKLAYKQKTQASCSLVSSSTEDWNRARSRTRKHHGSLVNGVNSGVDKACSVDIVLEKPQQRKSRKKRITTTEKDNDTKNKVLAGQHLFSFPQGPSNANFHLYESTTDLSNAVAEHIVQLSKEAVEQHNMFTIVLSRGSIVKVLSRLAQKPFVNHIDWEKWHIFWSERFSAQPFHPGNEPADDEFLPKVHIPRNQVHAIEEFEEAKAAAQAYEDKLRILVRKKLLPLEKLNKHPRFDLILLDLGLDGHIASLFPNSSLLVEERRWVVPFSKFQKPIHQGVTMTLPCINSAAHVAFVVFGTEKAEILQRVLERAALPGALPAQLVRLSDGVLSWFSDKEAASYLSIEQWNDSKKFSYFNFGPFQ
ncbi:hypothetical protein O6H91_09G034200 [Diphasiastrum complanatum]|uniref:Uncharacterized protein n=1 Tax=Diphasiastrum complanatum TaxID=34168 RepID=A0ACC2CN35_DIPCM|nr:hypothetical protein O6H91_09G034200 [Diphasiastrum complanatum]